MMSCGLEEYIGLMECMGMKVVGLRFSTFAVSMIFKIFKSGAASFQTKPSNCILTVENSVVIDLNRPFATNNHMVQNPPCWRASLFLFPHWEIKTKASQA